jgi:HEAT repeat protein
VERTVRAGAARSSARGLALLLGIVALACTRTDQQWRGDLGDRDPFVSGLAAIGLSFQAPREAGAAVPVLLQTIDREDVGLGDAAARALVHAGAHHVPLLLDELLKYDPSTERRNALKRALAAAGPAAVGPVLACMRGRGVEIIGDLGDVLLAIGPVAVPGIVEMLEEEPDARLRCFAAFLLASMGPRARSALPSLQRAASADDPDLRRMASEALASLEGRPWRVPVPGEGR